MARPQPVNFKGDWGDWEEREAWRERCKLFAVGEPVPLALLGRTMCRYPVKHSRKTVGGYLFCGRPTAAEHSYCQEHQALTAVAVRRR
jgi:hypothetical protein